jgi:hypothetical protein
MSLKTAFRFVNTEQYRNTSRRIQVNIKSQIPSDGLMRGNMLQETTNLLCVHNSYLGDGIK